MGVKRWKKRVVERNRRTKTIQKTIGMLRLRKIRFREEKRVEVEELEVGARGGGRTCGKRRVREWK